MCFCFIYIFCCCSKSLTNASMECSLYVFLLTVFIAPNKLSKSSFLSQITKNKVQQIPIDNISLRAAANKETKPFSVSNSNCQSFNQFERFSSWTCNAPQVTFFGAAVLAKPSTTIQKYHYRILVWGGISATEITKPEYNYVNSNQTWIYYEETNSWKRIASVANGPPGMVDFRLVNLCSSCAIIVSADAINITWIFSLEQLKWNRVTIVGNGPSSMDIHDNFTAVAVESEHSSCSCSQDVLVFFRIKERNHHVGYRLSCVLEHTTYRWEKVGNYTIPSLHGLRLVGGWSLETTVLALVDECIWEYSLKRSIWNKTKLCLPYDSWVKVKDVVSEVFFVNDTRQFLFISIENSLVIGLSVSNEVSFVEKIQVDDPLWKQPRTIDAKLEFHVYPLRVVDYGRIVKHYFFSFGESDTCVSSTWILQRRDVLGERSWNFARMDSSLIIPSDYGFQSLWKDTYYRIVFPSYDVRSAPPVMWSMNLLTKQWQMEGYLNVTGITITREIMQSVIVSIHMQENVWLIVSYKYTTLIASKDHIRQISSPIPLREGYSVVTFNSSSALLFGGRCPCGVAFNDLWQFSLTHQVWRKVKMIESVGSAPSPRYGHAAAVIGVDMFVFGGFNNSKTFSTVELWRFNMISISWSLIVATNPSPPLDHSCSYTATSHTGMLWIAAKCISLATRWNFKGTFNLWMFVVHLRTWNFVAIQKMENTPLNYIFSPLDFWQGHLLSLEHSSLVYVKAGCPQGLGSINISRVPCDVCKVGFYSDVETNKCHKCPNGTTTKKERSTRQIDCKICATGYCPYGRCLVVSKRSTQVPVCTCTIGFSGSRCQDATYYYIGMGVILVISIISFLVIVLWRTRKRRKERETALRRHIQTLHDAWQIVWQEIVLKDEIGGGASGRVWKAQYRDMDVAVKLLIDNDESKSSLEFAQEIKFMQTMRHPNIVLFIGAGKTSPQKQPFIVVELAHRGSLRHVLNDVIIEINQNRKIDFALDAAKGMKFLHQLDPPRIHRDIKSDNLLVSQSWIVKVADFGLGRHFCSTHKNRQSKQNDSLVRNNSETEFLMLETTDSSEDGIGTVRWSAPEIARRESYDVSVDVYRYSETSILLHLINYFVFSFGIVLWEIWSRGFPFEQYRFAHEVDDAVERGERPVVPDDCPEVYAKLMQDCWSKGARERPSFSEIVSRLENLHLEDAC